MHPVLVVESPYLELDALRERFRITQALVAVKGPWAAVQALHAAQFQVVIVSSECEDEPCYAALASTMRSLAPASVLMRVRSAARHGGHGDACPAHARDALAA